MVIHVVKPGDSIYEIGRIYGVSPDKIIADNEIKDPSKLAIGQTIVVLEANRRHTVAPGESIYSIARRYGTTVQSILDVNPQITNPAALTVGQVIVIPPTRKLGTIDVNGYSFPSIDMDVLRKTLPNLTYLSIFSYQVRPDGSLVTINDEPLIQAARDANVAPIMVITDIAEGASFSSDLASTILNNEQVQNTLISNVLQTLKAKNYHGLDVDFEYIYPRDKEKYNDFLRKISRTLHDQGYTLTTALAPKTSADQPGLLYEAHDYPVHGALTDHVIIMTYEWGYTYGPPQAVAPINEVAKVIRYAVTEIPSQKILMGIPNYGYDWTLPYRKGSAAKTLSNTGAVDLAVRAGAEIKYDTTSQAPFFSYYDSMGREHVVWFEDARSIEAKLMLVNRYNLGGVSYWTIGSYFPQNWLVLNSLYNVRKVI